MIPIKTDLVNNQLMISVTAKTCEYRGRHAIWRTTYDGADYLDMKQAFDDGYGRVNNDRYRRQLTITLHKNSGLTFKKVIPDDEADKIWIKHKYARRKREMEKRKRELQEKRKGSTDAAKEMKEINGNGSNDDVENGIRKCAFCKANKSKLLRCGRCKAVYYCSVDCQRPHWKTHKKICKKKQKAKASK